MITAASEEWIAPFTGLTPRQFRRLVQMAAARGGERILDGRPGRPWGLPLTDRVLGVVVYWRTNLTLRQVTPPFGISHAAAHRVVDSLAPLLAVAPAHRRSNDQVCIVDGTLVPTRDRGLAERSKNYRYSTNPRGRDPRRHPPGRRGRGAPAGEPQRLPGPTATPASTRP